MAQDAEQEKQQDSGPVYDVIVLGAGPGGYVAALKAAQLGLSTALVEKEPDLGGTCLRVGCIPSKALLHSSEQVHFLQHGAQGHGITVSNFSVDLARLMERKSKVVSTLTGGIAMMMKHRKVTVVQGTGKLTAAGEVTVQLADGSGETVLKADDVILATGSVPIELPHLKFDGQTVVSSTEALTFDPVPEKLVVVGGGAIGLELGSVWARLGSKVTVVEFLPQIAPGYDPDLAKALLKSLQGLGMEFHLETKVTGCELRDGRAYLTAERSGKTVNFDADKVLVSVGRRAFTEGCVADNVGVKLDERGRYVVDKHFQTSVKGVYAIGDAIVGPMLAHKAEEEAVALVEQLAGKAGHVNYENIPGVIYTNPEVAAVGLTEKVAKEKGIEVKSARFYMRANARALANDAAEGFVKVVADAKTDRLLGVHIIATNASELIAEAVSVMEFGGSAEDLGRTVHAHPTMSEALKEAALGIHKMSVNMA